MKAGEFLVKLLTNGLLVALAVFSAAMVLLGVRGADPDHAWAFIVLGVAGFGMVGVLVWGRRVLTEIERRGGQT